MTSKETTPKSHLYKGKYGAMDTKLLNALMYDLRNTPLQGYAARINGFFGSDFIQTFDDILPKVARDQIIPYIDECVSLAKYLKSIKEGNLKGAGWKITSGDDIRAIYDRIEKLVIEKLDRFYWLLSDFEDANINNVVIQEWEKLFSNFPCGEEFEYEDIELDENGDEVENGDRRLSLTEINYLIQDLERYQKIAKRLTVDTDKKLITRFLEYMLDAGVPHTREVYKELYTVLDNFGYISDEVKHSHVSTTSKYSESNYIKSLVNTILKHNERHQL